MKRVIILMVLVLGLLGTSLGYAEESVEQHAKALLNDYKDMMYSTTAGINRLDYGNEYRKLYISTQKHKDYLDADLVNDFNLILAMYDDAKFVWQEHYPVINYGTKKDLQKKYPNINKEIGQDVIGNFDTGEVIGFIWRQATDKTKELESKINNKYSKKIEESK